MSRPRTQGPAVGRKPPSPTAPPTAPPPTAAPAVGTVTALLGGLLFVALAVLAAVFAVLLVPLRYGDTVVPVSVVVAVISTVGLARLAGTATGHTVGAAAPVLAWIATVVALSQQRREGDVLLIGSAPLVYVTYAMLLLGAVAGISTVVSLDRRRTGRPPARGRGGDQARR